MSEQRHNGPVPLREQLRQVVGLTWRVVKVNPFRLFVMLGYKIAPDPAARRRIETWVSEAQRDDA